MNQALVDNPEGPTWISDREAKQFLRARKLSGEWTLTVIVKLLTSEVFDYLSPVYSDGLLFSKLSFFQIGSECGAIEWEPQTLDCRIWVIVRNVTKDEISKRLHSLWTAFHPFLDFTSGALMLEDEPNVITINKISEGQLEELKSLVANSELLFRAFQK